MNFQSLEQRMVHTYLDTFPPFVPAGPGPGEQSQQQLYLFMEGLYRRLMELPSLLFPTLHDDGAYTWRFNKSLDNNPKLKEYMKKALGGVDALIGTLYMLGQACNLDNDVLTIEDSSKLNKKHRFVLEQAGLRFDSERGLTAVTCDAYPQMPAALKWMATRPGASLLGFSRCLFRECYPYSSDIYAKLSGNESAFRRLERYLIEHGYSRIDNRDNQIALDYVKNQGGKEPPKGGFNYGVHHTGISAQYDPYVNEPAVFGLCIPRFREVLLAFDTMDSKLRSFIVARTKRCDNCRYCVQTDKTGKRALANLPVSHDGRNYRLCSYFPGYYYCWPKLDDEIAGSMIHMLGFMDKLFEVK